MTDPYKTPGVYIVEENAFPNSVVGVPTGVPAFVGYTEKADDKGKSLTGRPVHISKLAEFERFFGGPPPLAVTTDPDDDTKLRRDGSFILHQSMQFFFKNGGGACIIVSIGGYETKGKRTIPSASDFTAGIDALEAAPEPDLIVTPETCLLDRTTWASVTRHALQHCHKMQNRMAILDLWHGDYGLDASVSAADAPIANFRATVADAAGLGHGAAYYPWLDTDQHAAGTITYMNLDRYQRLDLFSVLQSELAALYAAQRRSRPIPADISGYLLDIRDGNASALAHTALMDIGLHYRSVMAEALKAVNLMPPSAAIAGIVAATDWRKGVWNPPANEPISQAIAPRIAINDSLQADLNAPPDGLAVNAIREFPQRGVLVWGARTLDSNSPDWRYINVRRTVTYLEQSIKAALRAYVFATNDASTWATVQAMLNNFLTGMWKQGALTGASTQEAFSVEIGLGTTMSPQDIQDGLMKAVVKVAIIHPAEFIVLSLEQQMAKS